MNVLIHSCLHCCLPLFYIIVISFWGRVPKIPIISETASHLFIISEHCPTFYNSSTFSLIPKIRSFLQRDFKLYLMMLVATGIIRH